MSVTVPQILVGDEGTTGTPNGEELVSSVA